MRTYYFDHAATSFPKAPGVAQAMADYLQQNGRNVGRGCYAPAYDAAAAVLELRERLCRHFGGGDPHNVILTPGATYGLNQVLFGLLRPGDRVVSTQVEHNAVARPLHALEAQGVLVERLPCDGAGALAPGWAAHITPGTRLVVMSHASNVTGALLPAAEVGRLCRSRGIFFCVDAAQTAGCLPLSMDALCADALVVPGHKGLLGPQGIGALLLTDALAGALRPLVWGGTGSQSELLDMPPMCPDRFEAGTPNLPGSFGLLAALRGLEGVDLAARRHREVRLTGHLMARLGELEPDGLRLLGPTAPQDRMGIVSADFSGLDNAEVAFRLEQEFGIQTRCGLHCAPLAHQCLGTYPGGTVRFSLGPETRFEDCDYIQGALCQIMGV